MRLSTEQLTKIRHVVIVIQENRTPDNLFHGLPGADTIPPPQVTLKQVRLVGDIDPSHTHDAFEANFHGTWHDYSMTYVDRSDVEPYFEMASEYAFADRMFQSNQGPSFPAHLYLIAGTSLISPNAKLKAAENPVDGPGNGNAQGGCDSVPRSKVWLITEEGDENEQAYPCFDRTTLMDLLAERGLSWKYYQEGATTGLWHAPDAIRHLRDAPDYYQHVITTPFQFLTDVAGGQLADVSWITPTREESDHPRTNTGGGPGWVRSVVNAVGRSKYWNDTAIFIVWDDWGGYYDHVKPPINKFYELGFRVPMIIISPYTPKGYVSHIQHEFGSILKFIERAFDLKSLGETDMRSDDLSDCFNFDKKRPFSPIP